MKVQNKSFTASNKRAWIIPVEFILMCIFLIGAILVIELIDYDTESIGFSIGTEFATIMIAIVIVAPILPSYKRQSLHVCMFVILLTMGSFLCLLDITRMCIDSSHVGDINKALAVFVFVTEVTFTLFYWFYMSHTLKTSKKITAILDIIACVAWLVFVVLPFINFFSPLYFYIDSEGYLRKSVDTWWICRIYMALIFVLAIVSLLISKEKLKNKITVVVFLGLPLFSVVAAGRTYDLSVIYPSMTVSLMLVYSLLSSDNEKHLYAKTKELNLATSIQMDALPNKFPAFPDHKEFDIYALMHPAKEVGGDFYDFFLIDDKHLGVVIADVSDKGVPSALFMMQSKIIIQNYAMMGLSPKEVLTKANKQLCANHQQKLFVTVWFAILDLETGLLTAANGGHEYPIIKKPDGQFEIYKDKHGIVLGMFDSFKYSEYQIQLEKGTKIFVYTDGVPECNGFDGQFKLNRAVEALNKYEDKSPEDICKSMLKELKEFMGNKDQFDDITMVCVEYRGLE